MNAFVHVSVPPLPARALINTTTLYEYAQPTLMRTWGTSYWNQVYFFMSFKVALTVVSSLFMIRLLRSGHFWCFRPVKVNGGTVIVPKATDAVIFLGACFIVSDAAYRFKTIQWFRGPTYEPMHNYLLLEALRVYPAWLCCWVHLCASSLVWPLRLDRLRPAIWNLVFFGVPVLFLATYTPAAILADRELEKGQAVYLVLERELLAEPDAPVTQWMQEQMSIAHDHASEAGYYSGIWLLVGFIWTSMVLIGDLVVGSTLLSRVYKAYSEVPSGTASHHTWSNLEPVVADSDHTLAASLSPPSQPSSPRISALRMAKYLAGFAPLVSSAPEVLSEPLSPAMTRRILRNFFFHSLTELVSLCTLTAIIAGLTLHMATQAYIELRENTYDARFGSSFLREQYVFHVVEMWAVVVFGTTLIVSMLKRQVYPLTLPTGQRYPLTKLKKLQDPNDDQPSASNASNTHASSGGGGNFSSARGIPYANSSIASAVPLAHSSSTLTTPDWLRGSVETPKRSSESISPRFTTSYPLSQHTLTDSKSIDGAESSTREAAPSAGLLTVPTLVPAVAAEEDLSWYAGHGTGRSIVLAALANGSDSAAARRGNAAWRLQAYYSHYTDVEARTCSPRRRYATDQGIFDAPVAPSFDEACSHSPNSSRVITSSGFWQVR